MDAVMVLLVGRFRTRKLQFTDAMMRIMKKIENRKKLEGYS